MFERTLLAVLAVSATTLVSCRPKWPRHGRPPVLSKATVAARQAQVKAKKASPRKTPPKVTAALKPPPKVEQPMKVPPPQTAQKTVPNPGVPGLIADPALTKTLAAALAKKPAGYTPRTHHLNADGQPKFTNRLILETSPYLLQHAHNPVNWFPWGEAAFQRAIELDLPILMSIGYSTCHWCHVMERESFEDLEIAKYINQNFVAIKVDREERPDVDEVYMAAARMLSQGNGGWPMTIMMTPDKQPFFGGTYFPARDGDRGARKGFFTILKELKTRYDTDRNAVVQDAQHVSSRMRTAAMPGRPGDIPGPGALHGSAHAFARSFDPIWGGFGRRPKFPRPVGLQFLLRYYRRSKDPQALKIVTHTLHKMAAGGMYDHIGGGFHRYATDTKWLVPHFEKMLYDNAQLTSLYLEAWQITKDADFARVAREILDYVAREMTAPGGAFYSATDADSPTPEGHSEEGWFFTWTPAEIEAVVGAETARIVNAAYGVTARGNFEGRNILNTPRPLDDVAETLKMTRASLDQVLSQAKKALYTAREKRPHPLLDAKVLTAWNGLMISAFAQGGLILNEPAYTERARVAAGFILDKMRTSDGRLLRTYNAGEARLSAYLDDYAFLIEGLLDLYEATGELRWYQAAKTLQGVLDTHYADRDVGGYFTTSDDHEALLVRDKPDYDGAKPAGNSVAARNLLRFAEYTSDASYKKRAERTFAAFSRWLGRGRTSQPRMLSALDFYLDTPREVIIVEPTPGSGDALLEVMRKTHLPNRVLVTVAADQVAAQTAAIPLLESKNAQNGQATAYVCEAGRCERPTSDPAVLAEQISVVVPIFSDHEIDPLPELMPAPDPKPWEYNEQTNKFWHPGHKHWHGGKPPKPSERK